MLEEHELVDLKMKPDPIRQRGRSLAEKIVQKQPLLLGEALVFEAKEPTAGGLQSHQMKVTRPQLQGEAYDIRNFPIIPLTGHRSNRGA